MWKKGLRIGALVLALALLAGVGYFANGLVGNPLSKLLAERTARGHLAQQYPDTDYVIESVGFNFKDGRYHARIISPSSRDSYFSLHLNMAGKLVWDDHERVTSGLNTALRLKEEYRRRTDQVLDSPQLPFACSIAYGDLAFVDSEDLGIEHFPDYAILQEQLVPDQIYDIDLLGAQAGELVIYVDDDRVTVERAAEILLELRRQMDHGGVAFRTLDFVLQHPKPEQGVRPDVRVDLLDFRYEDIYADGLEERVRAADAAAKEWFAQQDAEKQSEIAKDKTGRSSASGSAAGC